MGKGIAITTILLLLVGTLVAGVTVYYTYRSISGSPLSEHECRGMMVSWCIGCSNLNWQGGSGMDSQLSECANKYGWGTHNDCNALYDCSSFLPEAKGTEVCDNGIDDDRDGNVDCDDSDCSGDPACDCSSMGGVCADSCGDCPSGWGCFITSTECPNYCCYPP